MCPKCKSLKIDTWHGGGRWHAQCKSCLWHGLAKSLKSIDADKVVEFLAEIEGKYFFSDTKENLRLAFEL